MDHKECFPEQLVPHAPSSGLTTTSQSSCEQQPALIRAWYFYLPSHIIRSFPVSFDVSTLFYPGSLFDNIFIYFHVGLQHQRLIYESVQHCRIFTSTSIFGIKTLVDFAILNLPNLTSCMRLFVAKLSHMSSKCLVYVLFS